jgi:hypothetical protein
MDVLRASSSHDVPDEVELLDGHWWWEKLLR